MLLRSSIYLLFVSLQLEYIIQSLNFILFVGFLPQLVTPTGKTYFYLSFLDLDLDLVLILHTIFNNGYDRCCFH